MAEVTAVIDNLDEAMAEKLAEAGRFGRNRFEVALNNIWHGEQGEIVLHFSLVELTATSQLRVSDSERESYASIHTSGLGGSGPEFELPLYELRRVPELDPVQLAKLLTSIINLAKISPRVLGIEDGDEPAYKRVLNYLRKR